MGGMYDQFDIVKHRGPSGDITCQIATLSGSTQFIRQAPLLRRLSRRLRKLLPAVTVNEKCALTTLIKLTY